MGSAAPRFGVNSDGLKVGGGRRESVSLACPAQAAPVPTARSHCLTTLLFMSNNSHAQRGSIQLIRCIVAKCIVRKFLQNQLLDLLRSFLLIPFCLT